MTENGTMAIADAPDEWRLPGVFQPVRGGRHRLWQPPHLDLDNRPVGKGEALVNDEFGSHMINDAIGRPMASSDIGRLPSGGCSGCLGFALLIRVHLTFPRTRWPTKI